MKTEQTDRYTRITFNAGIIQTALVFRKDGVVTLRYGEASIHTEPGQISIYCNEFPHDPEENIAAISIGKERPRCNVPITIETFRDLAEHPMTKGFCEHEQLA